MKLHIKDTATGNEEILEFSKDAFPANIDEAAEMVIQAYMDQYHCFAEDANWGAFGFEPVACTEKTLIANSIPSSYWGPGHTLTASIMDY